MSDTIIAKQCNHCKEVKNISDFSKCRCNSDGLQKRCKKCHYIINKKYKKTEKGKESVRRYEKGEAGLITVKKKAAKYSRSRKGKLHGKEYRQGEVYRKYKIKYRKTETYKCGAKRYKAKHPEGVHAKDAVKYAVKTGKIFPASHYDCFLCLRPAEQYHHWSYEKRHQLSVIPFCAKCHATIHNPME